MAVFCQNCGKELKDPGGDLKNYNCGNCGKGPLARLPKGRVEGGEVVGAAIGAAIGAGVGGPIGAVIGALLGYKIGLNAGKKT